MKAYLPEQLFNQKTAASKAERFLLFPLWRLILFFIVLTFAYAASGVLCGSLPQLIAIPVSFILVGVTALILSANAWLENRPALELNLKSALVELPLGLIIGLCTFSSVVLVMWLLGVLQFEGVNAASNMLNMFPLLMLAGFIEEYIFRGIIFKLSEEMVGTWLAIIIQAALFGLVHAGNANATPFSTFAIAVEAGILLVAVYMLTRRLWMAIGVHFAWNWVQGPFFGIPVSGHDINGFFETTISGPELLTGGAFGAEASIVALIICTLVGLIILFRAIKIPGNIVKPMWMRKQPLLADNYKDDDHKDFE